MSNPAEKDFNQDSSFPIPVIDHKWLLKNCAYIIDRLTTQIELAAHYNQLSQHLQAHTAIREATGIVEEFSIISNLALFDSSQESIDIAVQYINLAIAILDQNASLLAQTSQFAFLLLNRKKRAELSNKFLQIFPKDKCVLSTHAESLYLLAEANIASRNFEAANAYIQMADTLILHVYDRLDNKVVMRWLKLSSAFSAQGQRALAAEQENKITIGHKLKQLENTIKNVA